jgi:hypothetical protein
MRHQFWNIRNLMAEMLIDKTEIAKGLVEAGIPVEIISQATGLIY